MICEKCEKKPAKVHILKARGDSEEAPSTPNEQHLCEDCAREYIQNDPRFKEGRWSKPTKRFVLDVGQLARKPKR
jgi:protein-arginine kinase activator protein McsA